MTDLWGRFTAPGRFHDAEVRAAARLQRREAAMFKRPSTKRKRALFLESAYLLIRLRNGIARFSGPLH